MSSERQTLKFLMRRFSEAGIRPNTRHGQNFLIDLNLVALLAETADLGPEDLVLEVGTGTGSLTALLAAKAAAVVTVEIDPRLYQLASEQLVDCANVTMLQQDALQSKNRFHPGLLAVLRERMAADGGRRLKLVSNLPYSVATPVISNLLLLDDLLPHSMTVTIQKELADRILAAPRTKDYGALSIWIQSQSAVEVIRVLPPNVFWPRPKVDSAILHIRPQRDRRSGIGDLPAFHAFVRAMFFHRRKFLRSELRSVCKGRLDKAAVDAVLEQQGLPPTARAEELTVSQMLELFRCLPQRAAAPAGPSGGTP